METSQRAKLMKGSESLKRSSASVGRAQQIAAETDQIAVDVIDELGNQRESLERTRDRVGVRFQYICTCHSQSSKMITGIMGKPTKLIKNHDGFS